MTVTYLSSPDDGGDYHDDYSDDDEDEDNLVWVLYIMVDLHIHIYDTPSKWEIQQFHP